MNMNLQAHRVQPLDPAIRQQVILSLGNLKAQMPGKVELHRGTVERAWSISASASPYHPVLRGVYAALKKVEQ